MRTNIKAEMARRGVTQHDLAAALGKTQQTISYKLRGGAAITVRELELIAGRLGVPTVDLYVDHVGTSGEAAVSA